MDASLVSRGTCRRLFDRMTRKKLIDSSDTDTLLSRCLSAKRLTFVGMGSMVGAGIYVLVGVAAKNLAGPSVIISFLLAAICVCMTSFCFAEFASRIPKSGNPYLYIYVVYGEFVAFLIGWGFIISYVTSGSLCSRAWSGYVDSLLNNGIKNYTLKHIGKWSVGDPVSEYPDFVAFGVQVSVLFIAATGTHCSTAVNSILAGLNVAVLGLVMVMGAVFGDVQNWHSQEHGGFFPFGIKGVMQGTSACFYAFFGFQTVCIAAEEAKDPSKSVPRALLSSIVITALLYVGTAIAFTLLVPFWMVNERAPLSAAFDHAGPAWMKYIVSLGPLFGFSNILILNSYGFSRLCFSLSEEGLLWKACSKVHKRTKVPMLPLIAGGLAMSVGAMCLDLENLFRFNVITTILPFSLVNFGVLILRYDPRYNKLRVDSAGEMKFMQPEKSTRRSGSTDPFIDTKAGSTLWLSYVTSELRAIVNCFGIRLYILTIFTCTALVSVVLMLGEDGFTEQNSISLIVVGLLVSIIAACVFAIASSERLEPASLFKVPFVPFFPLVSGMLNVFFLVAAVDKGSAIGYFTEFTLGILVYFGMCFCDLRHSSRAYGNSSVMEMETLIADDTDITSAHA
ncbi:high affinity cationic amino acid transporter 1-like [Liolophura sinensis]|uniref:high affinity cationic amino acid transporter 1-like n=1 Tax=Liolophura sinensis TaxID=3198878 RepID=UPI003158F074